MRGFIKGIAEASTCKVLANDESRVGIRSKYLHEQSKVASKMT